MSGFPSIDQAHDGLVRAVAYITQPGANPFPITLVSLDERATAQLVVFDEEKFTKHDAIKRLRVAADFLENHT